MKKMNDMNINVMNMINVLVTGFGVMGLGEFVCGMVFEPNCFTSGAIFAVAACAAYKKLTE